MSAPEQIRRPWPTAGIAGVAALAAQVKEGYGRVLAASDGARQAR